MEFFIKDFFSKCDKSRRELRIWSHLLKKSLMENFSFCVVYMQRRALCSNGPAIILVDVKQEAVVEMS